MRDALLKHVADMEELVIKILPVALRMHSELTASASRLHVTCGTVISPLPALSAALAASQMHGHWEAHQYYRVYQTQWAWAAFLSDVTRQHCDAPASMQGWPSKVVRCF